MLATPSYSINYFPLAASVSQEGDGFRREQHTPFPATTPFSGFPPCFLILPILKDWNASPKNISSQKRSKIKYARILWLFFLPLGLLFPATCLDAALQKNATEFYPWFTQHSLLIGITVYQYPLLISESFTKTQCVMHFVACRPEPRMNCSWERLSPRVKLRPVCLTAWPEKASNF